MPAVTPTTEPSRASGVSAETAASGQAPAPAGLLISTLAIPGLPEHARAAREFAALVLRVHSCDDDGTTGLLVTELVANSLAHSDSGKPGGTVTVTVTVTPEEILAEVADNGGDGEPVLRERADEASERGRGLRLVEELANGWGYFGGQGRLVTWFEIKTARQPS
jgi:anti-sigma regulatory factor (Ser/Thr protein kinase)